MKSSEISDEFLAQLKEDLVRRRVGRGMGALELQRHLFVSLDPQQKNAGRFVGYLAQWVDIGFQRPALLKDLISRFFRPLRSRLSLLDYMHLRLAEALVALTEEATDTALRHLDFLLSLDEATADPNSSRLRISGRAVVCV